MNRASLFLVASLVACGGGKAKQTNLAPLPDDKPKVAEPKKEEPKEPEPPKPLPPLEVPLDVPAANVKLVNAGKGKKAPLKYVAKEGTKQNVELVLTYAQIASMDGQTRPMIVPTILLTGEAETKAVDASGKADYTLSMSASDAREEPGTDVAVPVEQFKMMIATLANLVVNGSVEPNGVMASTTLRIEKPDKLSLGAVDIVKVMMPAWPVLPKEPVGVGAKWQTTTNQKIMGTEESLGIEMTHVTNYELVSRKGTEWTIKSKTKVSGKDQEYKGAKITGISGTGTSEIKVVDGALYPSSTSQMETKLTQSSGTESMQLSFNLGGRLTATTK